MIHTVTLNPTIDLTYLVDQFREEDTTRAYQVFRAPGGKGINVSRVVKRLGHPTIALGFMAGATGLELAQLLELEGVNTWFTPLDGLTRSNPIIQDRAGHHLRVSAPGPEADAAAVQSLWDSVFALRPPSFLLASGSRLRGVADDFYSRLITEAKSQGIRVVVDADGPELHNAVAQGVSLIKPNRFELMRLLGSELKTPAEFIKACQSLLANPDKAGIETVALSLGSAGALLVQTAGVWQAKPPRAASGSAVGAGDSFLAGLLVQLSEQQPPDRALAFAIACGTATALTPGTGLCTLDVVTELLAEVKVEQIE
jgi:6-phosphofructokinase 2